MAEEEVAAFGWKMKSAEENLAEDARPVLFGEGGEGTQKKPASHLCVVFSESDA